MCFWARPPYAGRPPASAQELAGHDPNNIDFIAARGAALICVDRTDEGLDLLYRAMRSSDILEYDVDLLSLAALGESRTGEKSTTPGCGSGKRSGSSNCSVLLTRPGLPWPPTKNRKKDNRSRHAGTKAAKERQDEHARFLISEIGNLSRQNAFCGRNKSAILPDPGCPGQSHLTLSGGDPLNKGADDADQVIPHAAAEEAFGFEAHFLMGLGSRCRCGPQ